MTYRMRRMIGALIFALAVTAGGARASDQFTPPDDTPALAAQLELVQTSLSQSDASDAALAEESLLRDHSFDLVGVEPGLSVSVLAQLANISGSEGDSLAAEYTRQFDAAAHDALQNRKLSGKLDARGCYAIARRYPRTPTAAAALALAGDLSAATGDLPSAADFYALAQNAGAQWTDDRNRRVAAIAAQLAPPAAGYCGPLPFDATWYVRPTLAPRVFPWVAGSTLFVLTPRRILAADEAGALLWEVPLSLPPQADPTTPAHLLHPAAPPSGPWTKTGRPPFLLRGAGQTRRLPQAGMPDQLNSFTPSVWSTFGLAQVVVARCGGNSGTTPLIAFAAVDGRRIWSTAEDASLASLYFSPSPTLCGRYVYDLATDPAAEPGALILIALDVATGREIWRTTLGGLSPTLQHAIGKAPAVGIGFGWDFFQSPGICVNGRRLLLAPNVAELFAVDRFDGKIDWIRDYPAKPTSIAREVAMRPRYDNRPAVMGDVVVSAGADGTEVNAYNTATGAKLWEDDFDPHSTLVGIDGTVAILVSDQVTALDCHTGQIVWQFQPTREVGKIDGPSTLNNGLLYLPTSNGDAVLSAATGALTDSPFLMRLWGAMMVPSQLRQALQEDLVLTTFARPGPPKRAVNVNIGTPAP
jgi:outer membrane protein assembly factor BamB